MALRAEELRIGNFIGLNLEEFPENYFRVLEPAEKSMKVTGYLSDVQRMETDFFDADLMDGIPLTKDWLKRFGFEYAEGFADDYTKKPVSLYNNPFKEGWTVENLFEQQIPEDVFTIRYVHQLQNLYFALTGEELKLN